MTLIFIQDDKLELLRSACRRVLSYSGYNSNIMLRHVGSFMLIVV